MATLTPGLGTGGEEGFALPDHTVPSIPMLIASMTTIEVLGTDAERAGPQSELIQFRLALLESYCLGCQVDRRNQFARLGANSRESRVEQVHRCRRSRVKHGFATVDGNPSFESPDFEHGGAKEKTGTGFLALPRTAMARPVTAETLRVP